MRIKTGDTVVVIAGKDKGKKGKVMRVLPKANRVIIENINMLTKHQKAQGPASPGGIIKMEGPINISNVMYYCENDKLGVRVGYDKLEDGTKVRVCKKCKEVLDK